MQYPFAAICIILSITPAVDCSTCLQCHQANSDVCEDKSIDCGEDSDCMTLSEYFKLGTKEFHSIYKDCAKHLPCNTQLYASDGQGDYIISQLKCCTGDDCNSNYFEMPELSEPEFSGRLCPRCFVEGSVKECTSDYTMMCREKGDQCLTYFGTVETPDGAITNYSVKGCMSSMGCNFGFSALVGVTERSCKNFTCSAPKDYQEEN
ncbi:phospholipase A2 inhibitor and Ly6/PLAUR domain-containing protein-like [Discoglossus pictus]